MKNKKLWLLAGLLGLFFLGHWFQKSALVRVAQFGLVLFSLLVSGFTLGLRLLVWGLTAWAIGYSVGGPDWLYDWLPKNTSMASFSVSDSGQGS